MGIALQTGAKNLATFVAGRFFAGFGVGLISMLVPMYQSECSPKWIRGAVVGGYQFAITVGILLANVINNATKDRTTHAAWQIPISIQFIWAFILAAGMTYLPESPRWLIDHDRESEALEILADLHGKGDPNNELVQLEFHEIKDQVRFERTEGAKSYLDLLRPGIFRRVTLGASLQMWSQLSGMNIMMCVLPPHLLVLLAH